MNNNISRRKLVAGAAWSAPAVLATTAVPAYASSTECLPDQSKGGLKKHENYAQELVWDVPADAKELHFEVTGAAGGSFSDDSTGITGIGGAGTTVKGIVRLNGTGKFTFIAGEGGGYNRGNSVNPGKGYGSGGAHGPSLTDRAGENAKEFFGPTGGGASAILFNNEPLVVAGAGGGAGILINQRSNDNQDLYWQMNEPIYGGSGGEKALTAIALLFAIQNLKPSPFALLDEIEAALDDSNVDRFAKYLHKLTDRTQFIVITHRRGTMVSADRLYGITMQEKGVSALVSVNLIENELDN